MLVYSTDSLWQQRVWRQDLTQLGALDSIVIPAIPRVRPRTEAEDLGTTTRIEGRSVKLRRYSVWLEFEPELEIESATYSFRPGNAPSWKGSSRDETPGFKYSYNGWGCLTSVRIEVVLENGGLIEGNFKMCRALSQ